MKWRQKKNNTREDQKLECDLYHCSDSERKRERSKIDDTITNQPDYVQTTCRRTYWCSRQHLQDPLSATATYIKLTDGLNYELYLFSWPLASYRVKLAFFSGEIK